MMCPTVVLPAPMKPTSTTTIGFSFTPRLRGMLPSALPSCWRPLLPPGNIHVLLRMDLSFPSPPPLPKLFPLEHGRLQSTVVSNYSVASGRLSAGWGW